jgi:hypothetical protein
VRWRKTSSSVERRTRVERGSVPDRATAPSCRVAVVGVDEHAVGQDLEAVADALERARMDAVVVDVVAHLDDLAGRVLLDERAWTPSATIRPWSMTTSRSHSCSASSM